MFCHNGGASKKIDDWALNGARHNKTEKGFMKARTMVRRASGAAAIALALGAGVHNAQAQGAATALPAPFLALQPLAQTQRATLADGSRAELLNVNASVGRWYLLSAQESDGSTRIAHLDAGVEKGATLALTPQGLSVERNGQVRVCPLGKKSERDLALADASRPFALLPACGVWIRDRKSVV